MSYLVLACLMAAGNDGLPRSLAQEPEGYRPETVPPPEGTVTEYILRHHRLEGGLLYTVFEKDLDIESDVAWWIRTGVALTPNLSVHATYRHYDFTNSSLPGGAEEDVDIRGLFGGFSLRVPLSYDFALSAGAAIGAIRWESHGTDLDDDTGPALTTEAVLVWTITPFFRVRVGAGLDFARTEFHEDGDELRTLVNYTLGLELGGW